MTPWLGQLSEMLEPLDLLIWQAGMVFIRIGAMIALIPALGEGFLPMRVKITATLALTCAVTPTLALGPSAPLAHWRSLEAISLGDLLVEAGAGLILGFSLRLMIHALQIAGTIAAQSMSLAQMFSGTGMEPQPILSNLMALAGTAFFCTVGGLSRAVELLVLSYEIFPAGKIAEAGPFSGWAVRRVGDIFALGFILAAPFTLAALLYNLTLGIINRAMPMLMVTLIGAPALTLGGLVLLALVTPSLFQRWREGLLQLLGAPWAG